MADSKVFKTWHDKVNFWLPNIYYVAMLVSVILIFLQILSAKQTAVESAKWEKAKMTISNVETLQNSLESTIFVNKDEETNFLLKANYNDITEWSKEQIDELIQDKLYVNCKSREDTSLVSFETRKVARALDKFAYAIINDYANDYGSYTTVGEYFVRWSQVAGGRLYFNDYIEFPNARLLYKLWHCRLDIQTTNLAIAHPEVLNDLVLTKDQLITHKADLVKKQVIVNKEIKDYAALMQSKE